MQALRKRRLVSWAVVLWGLFLLVPPGAWALCIGGDGHVAFEIGEGTCTDAETRVDPEPATCCESECGPCVDIPVLRGLALRSERPSLDALPALPPSSLAPAAECTPDGGAPESTSAGLVVPIAGRAGFYLRI